MSLPCPITPQSMAVPQSRHRQQWLLRRPFEISEIGSKERDSPPLSSPRAANTTQRSRNHAELKSITFLRPHRVRHAPRHCRYRQRHHLFPQTKKQKEIGPSPNCQPLAPPSFGPQRICTTTTISPSNNSTTTGTTALCAACAVWKRCSSNTGAINWSGHGDSAYHGPSPRVLRPGRRRREPRAGRGATARPAASRVLCTGHGGGTGACGRVLSGSGSASVGAGSDCSRSCCGPSDRSRSECKQAGSCSYRGNERRGGGIVGGWVLDE